MAIVDLGIEGLSQYDEIGSGGFAVVYSAREESASRTVAVKVLHAMNDAGRRRFERERRTMGSTTGHPNIVTLLRSGFTQADNRPFLVMEYLDGGSLRQRIDTSGALPLDEAISITADIADALRFSHGKGVLHKDVKPGNVLLSSSGAAKLTDFGIAAIQEATEASQIAFSMAYTAPESFTAAQDPIDGSVVDPRDERSDLYSLGATFYSLVTGRRPFVGANQVALMRQIVDASPPPTGYPGVDRFLAIALAKDPAERFADAEAFSTALAQITPTEQPTTTSTKLIGPPDEDPSPPFGPITLVAPQTAGETTTSEPRSAPAPAPGAPLDDERRSWSLLGVGLVLVTALVGGAYLWLQGGDSTVADQLSPPSDDVAAQDQDGPGDDEAPDEAASDGDTDDDQDGDGEAGDGGADDGDPESLEVETVVNSTPFVFTGHRDRADDPSTDGVLAVVELRNGRMASAGADGTAQIWDTEPLEPGAVLYTGHDEAVRTIAELPDGRIASAGADGTVHLWDRDAPETTGRGLRRPSDRGRRSERGRHHVPDRADRRAAGVGRRLRHRPPVGPRRHRRRPDDLQRPPRPSR